MTLQLHGTHLTSTPQPTVRGEGHKPARAKGDQEARVTNVTTLAREKFSALNLRTGICLAALAIASFIPIVTAKGNETDMAVFTKNDSSSLPLIELPIEKNMDGCWLGC